MDTFRIQFELRPLVEVQPWGTPESGFKLHWFGLTDGWYDLVIADQHLFRDPHGDVRGIDYAVVRLWEDLIAVAPAALEEIPHALAERVAAADRWSDWTQRAWELDDALDLCETALSWWHDRVLDTGYLRGAPRPQFWRCGEELHVRWHSRSRTSEEPEWSSPSGEATVGVGTFKDELVRFDRALIEAMRARIESVATDWPRPEIAIDVRELRLEHVERSAWRARALTTWRPHYSWQEVLVAIEALEDRIGSALG